MADLPRFDHGLLNLPLHKRPGGNIDAQIDRYKAAELVAANAARIQRSAARKAAKPIALALVQAAPEAVLDRLAARAGLSMVAMRRRLVSDCHWQPQAVIDLLSA